MKNLFLIGFILLAFLSGMARGETLEEERRIEEGKRKALEETELKILEGEKRLVIDYGGWINYRYDDYNDDDNDSTSVDSLDETHSLDFRFWMKAALRPRADALDAHEHSLYIRLKDLQIDREPDDTGDGDDHDGAHLDYLYLILDFNPLWFEIGRRYFSVGQGIAYSNRNDGVESYLSLENWTLKGFVSRTLPHEENIDTSIPGWDKKSERTYYAIEGTYLGIHDHGIYSYFLMQRDDTDENPSDLLHDYTYDSEYLGLGAQGKLLSNMHYWLEIIRESGKSRVYATGQKRNVDAWAGDFGLSYDWDIYSHPNISFEYAFGSGDSDRTSVTDTSNGNTSGDDRNFLYFGYLPAGYALSPRLSNIYFYKGGVLLKPLEKYDFFKNFSFGTDFYRYYKDKQPGGVYDTDAVLNDHDIGSEIDLNISWQIISDLSCSVQYGHFWPGDAYPDYADDSEKYLAAGMTFTF